MSVSAIIVNYKTKELTAQAVQSCLLEPEIEQVVVVDNASGDDSVEWLRNEFSGQNVYVIPSERNLGFGGGNNLAVEEATGDHLFLINSDAYVLPGAVGALLKGLREDVGIVAPLVLEKDEMSVQADNFGRFPSVSTVLFRTAGLTKPHEPDWVSGVSFLIRKADYQFIGGFDDRFFMYLEDVDLCRRMRLNGRKIVRELSAKVVHLGGQSKTSTISQKKQYYASQDMYFMLSGVPPIPHLFVKLLRWPIFYLKQALGR